jgi:diguanylate cyclase (GGDEF)-like protein
MAETVMDREAQLRENAARDSLTGLYNHGRVDEFLALEMRRNRRSNGIVSFAMIDIDHFKLVNDNYGHLAGDEVLKGLARILEANVREGDLVGRFGGEEFAVILAASPPEVTRAFCERLRQLVADTVFRFEDLEMRVTVSIGWASARPTLAEAVDIIQWADQALYQAKESGRNAVRGGLASVGNPPVIG